MDNVFGDKSIVKNRKDFKWNVSQSDCMLRLFNNANTLDKSLFVESH
jgi:hypothetical protein